MPGTGPSSMLTLGADVAQVLVRIDDPKITEFQLRGAQGLFTGGMNIATSGFTAGGYRARVRTQTPHNTRSMGATSGSTAVPAPNSNYRYSDLVYKREHFTDLLTPVKWEQQFADYVHSAPTYQDGVEDIAAKLMADSLLDFQHTVNTLQIANRAGILGTVVAFTAMDGTTAFSTLSNSTVDTETAAASGDMGTDPVSGTAYAGKIKGYLFLGVDAIANAFQPGIDLTISTKPTYYGLTTYVGGAITTLKTYFGTTAYGSSGVCSALRVDGMPVLFDTPDSNGAILRVPVAMYYTVAPAGTTTNGDYILTMLKAVTSGAVGTGDVVTFWAGDGLQTATSGTYSTYTPTFGPNYGMQGLLHWFDRANIESATGACSTALYSSNAVAVSRLATGNWSFWYPYVNQAGTSLTKITVAMVQQVMRNMKFRGSNALPIASTSIINTLTAEIGAAPYRQNVASWDPKTQERWQSYGFQGVTIQGPGITPVSIAQSDWIPANILPFVDPAVLTLMAPIPPEWKTLNTGSIWFEGRNSSGQVTLNSQAFRMWGIQQHAYDLWNWGGVTLCKP
jgi:hypothetical protein